MNNNRPLPQHLFAISFKAGELLEMLREIGATRIGYFNPNPEGLPDLPWSNTTLANLVSDLYSVAQLMDDETEREEWGITDEVIDEVLEAVRL